MQLENAERGHARAWHWLLAAALLVVLSACGTSIQSALFPEPSSRVLFIGNSYTDYNGGLDLELKGLDTSIAAQRIAVGGYTLQDHWNSGEALQALGAQKWDFVVLQEQSQTAVTGHALFAQYAAKFVQAIRAAGAEPVLMMTWQRPDSVQFGVTTQSLANAYYDAGNRYGARVAPAGIAFANALWQRPSIVLNSEDGHPTPQGSYLAACVLYATLYGKSPVGLRYTAQGITTDERDFLQRVAAESTGH